MLKYNSRKNQTSKIRFKNTTYRLESSRAKSEASDAWEKELGKIRITSDYNDQKTIFYTALYHTCFLPVVQSDVDELTRDLTSSFMKPMVISTMMVLHSGIHSGQNIHCTACLTRVFTVI